MVRTMMKCTASLLQTWEQKVQLGKGEVELEINNEMRITTSDIIAHTAFSINYEKGKQVFTKMDNLVLALFKAYNNPFFWIPNYMFTFLSLIWKHISLMNVLTYIPLKIIVNMHTTLFLVRMFNVQNFMPFKYRVLKVASLDIADSFQLQITQGLLN
jgi:hypothetical protein